MALTNAAGQFNFGIAGSSVTDWRLYDSVYTERYMDQPAREPGGLQGGRGPDLGRPLQGRAAPDARHDRRQRPHAADGAAVRLADDHDKRFELMIYPDSRHGIQASQRAHQARESHDFWVRNLLGGRLPDVVIETRTDRPAPVTRETKKAEKPKEKERTP